MTAVLAEAPDLTDLLGEEVTQTPASYLAPLRDRAPVHWNERHRAWLVTSYEQVSNGFRDARLSSNRLKRYRETRVKDSEQATIGRTLRLLESWMVFQDGPEHRRLKSVVHKAFTPQFVASMEADIRVLVKEQIAELLRRLEAQPDKPVDLLNEIAYEIPGPIICKMLGVPESDRFRFIDWTEQISLVIGGFTDDDNRYEKAHVAVTELESYLNQVIENTSANDDNLMSRLVAAEAEGEKLSRDEAIATGIVVLFGGNRTTSCMIANGVRALMLHPEQQELLRQDPKLIGPAVEEIMRWEAHTKFTVRIAGEDFEWEGQQIKAGQRVFLSPLSANHDESMFPEAARFDIKRANASRHLSFGMGVHLCLGQALARLELRIMFSEILEVLPRLKLVEPEGVWLPTLINRVQKRLLVTAA